LIPNQRRPTASLGGGGSVCGSDRRPRPACPRLATLSAPLPSHVLPSLPVIARPPLSPRIFFGVRPSYRRRSRRGRGSCEGNFSRAADRPRRFYVLCGWDGNLAVGLTGRVFSLKRPLLRPLCGKARCWARVSVLQAFARDAGPHEKNHVGAKAPPDAAPAWPL
jgi:hypothetical protein